MKNTAVGALAALVLIIAGGLMQPASANAAAANWYYHQLDNDRCVDAAQWWNGSRWLGYYWLDTNNDCSFGETYVVDADNNGIGDEVWMRRGNSGNWAAAFNVHSKMVCQGQNQTSYGSYYQHQEFGTLWSSCGFYQSSVGPPSNPSGAYNLALAFARQGYVYY
jgi:hypothetical protein